MSMDNFDVHYVTSQKSEYHIFVFVPCFIHFNLVSWYSILLLSLDDTSGIMEEGKSTELLV